MRTTALVLLIGAPLVLGGCGKLGGGGDDSKTSQPPTPTVPSVVDFSGTYKSTWGPTTFLQDGNRVTAKYPNGNMKCVATGNQLDCDWVEGSTFGKAKLAKQADNKITGTWGNGGSASNGGQWIFYR